MSSEVASEREPDPFEQACVALVDGIIEGEIDRDDLESAKLSVCSEFSAPKVPKNTELLEHPAAPPASFPHRRATPATSPPRPAASRTTTTPTARSHSDSINCEPSVTRSTRSNSS